jgi:hypothetical protein
MSSSSSCKRAVARPRAIYNPVTLCKPPLALLYTAEITVKTP